MAGLAEISGVVSALGGQKTELRCILSVLREELWAALGTPGASLAIFKNRWLLCFFVFKRRVAVLLPEEYESRLLQVSDHTDKRWLPADCSVGGSTRCVHGECLLYRTPVSWAVGLWQLSFSYVCPQEPRHYLVFRRCRIHGCVVNGWVVLALCA